MKGAIARCSLGTLGLITSDGPVPVTYKDGNSGIAWVGIHLTDAIAPLGSSWSSRNPRIVMLPSDFETTFTMAETTLRPS